MLDEYVTVDDKSQSFSTPIKNKHSDTATISDRNCFGQVPLGYYPLQYQQYITHQKIPPSGK